MTRRTYDITDEGYLPRRGDYNTEYAGQLVELIERNRCARGQGCVNAGTEADIAEHGPGGVCPHLAEVLLPARCSVLVPGVAFAPQCTAYEQRPLPVPDGQEPLL